MTRILKKNTPHSPYYWSLPKAVVIINVKGVYVFAETFMGGYLWADILYEKCGVSDFAQLRNQNIPPPAYVTDSSLTY